MSNEFINHREVFFKKDNLKELNKTLLCFCCRAAYKKNPFIVSCLFAWWKGCGVLNRASL